MLRIPKYKTKKVGEAGLPFKELELAQNAVDRAHDYGNSEGLRILAGDTNPYE